MRQIRWIDSTKEAMTFSLEDLSKVVNERTVLEAINSRIA